MKKKKRPTKLKKMKLNSVDFVNRGANPEAHIAIAKSYDGDEVEEIDIAKAEQDLTLFTNVLEESFSSIMKDDTLDQEERISLLHKSLSEFNDTLGDYLSSFDKLEKSFEEPEDGTRTANAALKTSTLRKGEDATMTNYSNVDKSRLEPADLAALEALIAKAHGEEVEADEKKKGPAGKVDPEQAKEGEEDNLPPEVKKALKEVEDLKKSLEMRELESIAKKYEEPLGKKASETAQILYDLKKSNASGYNAYIALLDEQVSLVEKSGTFAEIGKSGNYNYGPVSKSTSETKIEAIAKTYRESDPAMDYATSIAKAWEDNPDLMAAYEQEAGF